MTVVNAHFVLGEDASTVDASIVDEAMAAMAQQRIVARIWEKDHTVWRPDPKEITNRLDWLDMPHAMRSEIDRLTALATAVRADGFTDVLLLGMGGSSLAPEVFYKTFGAFTDGLALAIVDTTDPDAIRAIEAGVDVSKTLFIVATKSGGTVETLSAFKYFYNRVAETVGTAQAGRQFIAITDPGSKLVTLAEKYDFRDTFLNNPNIGGRYSVLSFFGLVPAALVGVDVARLLDRAAAAAADSQQTEDNVSARVGVAMGELAKIGRDKLTFLLSPAILSFGDWVEQLIAESTGKEGKGILPVVGEPLLNAADYGADRLFVYLRLTGDSTFDDAVAALTQAGQPAITLSLQDLYDLGAQFFLWELATAVAGHCLDIQPFDQPNVEAAKVQARKMVAAYEESGQLPAATTAPPSADALHALLAQATPGDYVAVHAYVPPTPDTDAALAALRERLLQQTKLATTVGYGPRFLHSTGQLHKGDGNNGLFIQLISAPVHDLPIPDEAGADASSMTFGVLKQAQAMGDAAALREANRRLVAFDLDSDVLAGLQQLTD